MWQLGRHQWMTLWKTPQEMCQTQKAFKKQDTFCSQTNNRNINNDTLWDSKDSSGTLCVILCDWFPTLIRNSPFRPPFFKILAHITHFHYTTEAPQPLNKQHPTFSSFWVLPTFIEANSLNFEGEVKIGEWSHKHTSLTFFYLSSYSLNLATVPVVMIIIHQQFPLCNQSSAKCHQSWEWVEWEFHCD